MKFFFIRILHFVNVYKPSHKKSHFSKNSHILQKKKKKITFGSGGHNEKVNISPNILTFFAQNWHFCTKIDIDANTRRFASKFARHYSLTVLRNSLIYPKTDAFCIKCYFLLKENNATKNWHFSKTEDTSLRKLIILLH